MSKIEKTMTYAVKTSADTGVKNDLLNPTKSDKKELLDGSNITTPEQKEQERTRVKKDLFITFYKKTLGSIGATCDKVDISRDTYYEWLKRDPVFNQKIRASFEDKLNDVEQQLNQAVLKGDVSAIRYFLDRRHPLYMPKIKVVAPKAGEKSIEDLILEGEWKDTNELYEIIDTTKTGVELKDNNREELQDKKQEGTDGPVRIEPGATLLLDEKNETKSDTQVSPGGTK